MAASAGEGVVGALGRGVKEPVLVSEPPPTTEAVPLALAASGELLALPVAEEISLAVREARGLMEFEWQALEVGEGRALALAGREARGLRLLRGLTVELTLFANPVAVRKGLGLVVEEGGNGVAVGCNAVALAGGTVVSVAAREGKEAADFERRALCEA